MYAKYIKREIADLNGTGKTQAYYKMQLKPKSFEEFVSQCAREGNMEESLHKLALDPSSGITSRGQRSQKYYVLRNQ